MKKTLFNASLEESMNLVTDKYIKTSMDDMNQHGYQNKILGFLTIDFILWLISFVGPYMDREAGLLLFVKAEWLFRIPMILGWIFTVCYLIELRKVKQQRILSYYIYNKNMFLVMSCLLFQTWLVFAAGFSMIWGPLLTIVIQLPLLILVIFERIVSFIKKTKGTLYKGQSSSNVLYDFLDKFVIFSKKYGGVAVLLLFVVRFLFRSGFQHVTGEDIYHNDFLRSIVLTFGIIGPLIAFYFSVAIASSSMEGYYLEKYSEDYRQLSGYSIEEWYGLTSKQYKESLKK